MWESQPVKSTILQNKETTRDELLLLYHSCSTSREASRLALLDMGKWGQAADSLELHRTRGGGGWQHGVVGAALARWSEVVPVTKIR
jgi:hypothetical protein